MAEAEVCTLCSKSSVDVQLLDELKKLLPADFCYNICIIKRSVEDFLQAEFRMELDSPKNFEVWKEKFQHHTYTTYRVQHTRASTGMKVVYKREFLCQHGNKDSRYEEVRKGRYRSKKTGCRSTLSVKMFAPVEQDRKKRIRSKDPHAGSTWNTLIRLTWGHNHPIKDAGVLRYRDVGEATIQRFMKLFEQGHSCTSAMNQYQTECQQEHGEDYVHLSGDRHYMPELDYVRRLHNDFLERRDGRYQGLLSVTKIRDILVRMTKDTDAKFDLCESTDGFAIAILTPFMQRVHTMIPQSGELVFLDGSNITDRYHTKVHLLMTHSAVGGLPLGCFLTFSESAVALQAGLQLLMGLIGGEGFYGRGPEGPDVIMTDDSAAEKAALEQVFPCSKQLLCTFHILQAFWRYLWSGHTGVPRGSRPHLFKILKNLIYAESEGKFMELYDEAITHDVVIQEHPSVRHHIEKLVAGRDQWALSFRFLSPTKGNNATNFVEAAFSAFKENILRRQRCISIASLVRFLVNALPRHYIHKIIELVKCSGKVSGLSKASKTVDKCGEIAAEDIAQLDDNIFLVPGTCGKEYYVNITISTCSCPQGQSGAPCKHQLAVQNLKFLPVTPFPFCGTEDHIFYYKVATGHSNVETVDSLVLEDIDKDVRLAAVSDDGNEVDDVVERQIDSIDGREAVGVVERQAVGVDEREKGTNEISKLKEQMKLSFDNLVSALDQDPNTFFQPFSTFFGKLAQKKTPTQLATFMASAISDCSTSLPVQKASCKRKMPLTGSVLL